MKKVLHILQHNKQSVTMLSLLVLYLLSFTTEAAGQPLIQSGTLSTGSKAQAGNSIAIGEFIWIAITLIFSFILNTYLRRKENSPQKNDFTEPVQSTQTMAAIPVKVKSDTTRKVTVKRTKKIIHRFAYQREQISNPVTAIQYFTVSHKKTGVAF